MMIVFEAGMSRPDSTIAVETSTSYSPATYRVIVRSSADSGMWP